MSGNPEHFPAEIVRDAGALIAALRANGWIVNGFRYDAAVMGNWHIDLAHGDRSLQIVRDRSQLFVAGHPIEELKAQVYAVRLMIRQSFTWVVKKPRV